MITQIWLNGALCDLNDDTNIRHTLQVNDIAEVKDRQASRTNTFALPKTARNVQILGGLGLASDSSPIPYRKLPCQIKLEGFELIVKGWANVTETNENYQVHIYSGIIGLFKAIENKTLGKDLDLSEINHEKTLASVIASQANPNYRYLLADYNGKTHFGDNDSIVNIDYLIPSVAVAYLWNKIFNKIGHTFAGSIFTDEDFTNLWLTYPKGITVDTVTEFENRTGTENYSQASPYTFGQGDIGAPMFATNSGKYRFDIDLQLTGPNALDIGGIPLRFQIWRNSVIAEEFLLYATGSHQLGTDINFNTNDIISFRWEWPTVGNYSLSLGYDITTSFIVNYNYSFSEELKDFAITDFVKEILNRFGLTMFPSEFTNQIEFLTISERVNYPVKVDWSDKYIERKNENYVFDSYAKQNNFSFQYNDKESSHANGSLFINNQNLPETLNVFASKTYAAEKDFVPFKLGSETINVNVFKIYDKDINERNGEQEIKYKGLDKRYHFLSSRAIDNTFELGSERMDEDQTVTGFNVGQVRQTWTELVQKYYNHFNAIISQSRLHDIVLDLDLASVLQLDFRHQYYFHQEQQYYFLNKLMFDDRGASGEFVRVSKGVETYVPPTPENPTLIQISWIDGTAYNRQGTETTQALKIASATTGPSNPFSGFEWQKLNFNWQGLGTGVTPYTAALSDGENRFRMKATTPAGDIYSNELKYTKIILPPCKRYTFGYGGSQPVHTGTVTFKDCDGVLRTYSLTWNESSGNYYEIQICAIEIISYNEFVIDVTNYANQPNCI